MTKPGDDGNIFLDAQDDDWAWRRRLRANPVTRHAYRVAVAVVGLAIVVLGLVLVPAPGPGWLIVFAGIAVWATEFEWAQNLLRFARRTLHRWTEWMKAQPVWVRVLVGLATLLAVLAVFWLLFKLAGVPGFFPDGVEGWLKDSAGLG
ncbi:MAG TPA: TIGR02611 family protein [Dermatophilaceae bacterium]|nr:TIGR02611 family protein [Dermatophilaceae bacterium]